MSRRALTIVPFMYRDGDNYKSPGALILEGEMTRAQRASLTRTLESGEHFIPTQIGVRHLGFALENFPRESDHVWHEMLTEEIEVSSIAATDGDRPAGWIEFGTVETFLTAMQTSADAGWNDAISADDIPDL